MFSETYLQLNWLLRALEFFILQNKKIQEPYQGAVKN